MQTVSEPSKLCKDIFELEKDFRYNLFLLKIRDSEIARVVNLLKLYKTSKPRFLAIATILFYECVQTLAGYTVYLFVRQLSVIYTTHTKYLRCKNENDSLLHNLKQKEQQNMETLSNLHNIESKLSSTNAEKLNMKISYEDTIERLTRDLTQLKETFDNYKRDQRKQTKNREAEFEQICRNITNSKDEIRRHEVGEVNLRLQRETTSLQKVKCQLEEVITENLSLRNELQEKQSQYVSKLCILESELRAFQEEKLNLEQKVETYEKNSSYFEEELKKRIKENDQIKQELFNIVEENKNLQINLKKISVEKDNLKNQLNKLTNELKISVDNLEILKDEKSKLQVEYYHKLEEKKCTIIEHENFDNIMKQNSILQEVVKAMKRERKESFDTKEMESKMGKLENLVQCLKASMLSNLSKNLEEY